MSEPLLPTRFHLDEDQLATALKLAGISPDKRSMLPYNPAAAGNIRTLEKTGVLDKDSNNLKAETIATLNVAATPEYMLSLIANNSDDDTWVETSFLHGNGKTPFVALAAKEKRYDFVLLPTATQAAILIDDLLGLTSMVSRPGDSRVDLNLAGYAAMLAMTDIIQEARLQARIERARKPVPAIAVQSLEEQLKKGLANTDTRWAVTAGRMVCPTHLRSAAGRMKEGAEQLKAGGFLNKSSKDYSLTQSGFILGSGLGQLVNTAGFSLAIGKNDGRLTIAHASLFRTAFSIWIVTWSDVISEDARCLLSEVSTSGALGFVRNFLEPVNLLKSLEKEEALVQEAAPISAEAAPVTAAVEKAKAPAAAATSAGAEVTCRFCGKKNPDGSAFCRGCGRELPKPAAAAEPEARFCRHCGRINAPDAQFCNGCGKEMT